jgi:1,2-phenylacetyl-CoA epoxidase catalytic subunit
MNDTVKESLKSELLCIADSNWVLGHWYIACMLNGRELTDFTSISGIAEEKLGHARVLLRFLEEDLNLPEFQLEFGRKANQIHSMEGLDGAPTNWSDFIISLFLADIALWRFSSTFKDGNHGAIANLTRKFGEECYFHQLCIEGWLQGFSDEEKSQAKEALQNRLPKVLSWFGSEEMAENDILLKEGIRTQSAWDARQNFIENVLNKLADIIELTDSELSELMENSNKDLDVQRRRTKNSELPARLWELMVPTSKEAEIARRPLAVSITDSIDLFQNPAKKGDTEPVFDK